MLWLVRYYRKFIHSSLEEHKFPKNTETETLTGLFSFYLFISRPTFRKWSTFNKSAKIQKSYLCWIYYIHCKQVSRWRTCKPFECHVAYSHNIFKCWVWWYCTKYLLWSWYCGQHRNYGECFCFFQQRIKRNEYHQLRITKSI